jgi:hypothetical protein
MPCSPIQAPTCILLLSALHIHRLPPQITSGSMPFPLQPSQLAHRTPKPMAQAQALPPSHRQTSECKTLLLYVACVVHHPWTSPLEVWTSSHFRRIAAGYGFVQDIHMLSLFSFFFFF